MTPINDSRYSKDDNNVYDTFYSENIIVIKGADPKTFTILNSFYNRDKKFVYYGGSILSNADPKSFEILSDKLEFYAKDKSKVFYNSWSNEGADPN